MTDNQPLKWLMESDKLTGKLAGWALLLQEYDFEVVHKAGVKNLDADGLSRNPSPLQEDLTGARWHGTSDQEAISGWHASAYLTWNIVLVKLAPKQVPFILVSQDFNSQKTSKILLHFYYPYHQKWNYKI